MNKSPDAPAILDARSLAEYQHARPSGAVHLSLRDVVQCGYLLPPRSQEMNLVAADSTELQQTLRALHKAERRVRVVDATSWREIFKVETGPPTRTRLWQPSLGVAQAYASFRHLLPGDRAMDVACGSGRNGVYLAMQGMQVVGIDWQQDALQRARDLAQRSGVQIETQQLDLRETGVLQTNHSDFIVVARYLDRNLFAALQTSLAPRGLLVYETFAQKQAALGHPKNPNYLLQQGELRSAFPKLTTLDYVEAFQEGAHLARLVAQRQ